MGTPFTLPCHFVSHYSQSKAYEASLTAEIAELLCGYQHSEQNLYEGATSLTQHNSLGG